MFKFTLTITTSVFLLMSGAVDVFAMNAWNDDKKALATTHGMHQDVMGVIFKEASKENNPRHLTSVCKFWYNIIRENQDSQGKELHYSEMNSFMKELMQIFWESRFYNGILRHTPRDGSEGVTLKFSLLNKDGTFDLSDCGDACQHLVITSNVDRFFKIEEENKDMTVILITLYSWVEQEINALPIHSFAALMADWNADKAPVGMFWRWGNCEDLTYFDYLTNVSMSTISSMNIYDNWFEQWDGGRADRATMPCWQQSMFHVNF